MTTGLSLEAYVGVVISLVIIKAGIDMMKDTVNDILGQRADVDVSRKIKRVIAKEPGIRGAYDLLLHNYGPDKNYGSVHIELPDTMTVDQVDELTRRVEADVYKETGVILTGVGVYSYNTKSDEVAGIRNKVQKKVLSHDFVLQMHGFYLDMDSRAMRFDVVLSFDISPKEALVILYGEVQKEFPEYHIEITPDRDISD